MKTPESNPLRSPLVAGGLLATTVALLAAACQTVPYTGRKQAVVIPQSQLETMGSEAFSELLAEQPPLASGPTVSQVRSVGDEIVRQTPPDYASQDWQIEVIDSEEANAFALPGGKIGIYTGILPILENEAGLASVTGHEVGHVVAQHSGERVSRAMIVQLGLSVADIGLSNSAVHDELMSLLGLGSVVGIELPYSRANESEADELGGILMAKAGYDPRESWAVWERMSANRNGGQPLAVLSTHPSDTARISNLKSLLPTFERYYDEASVKHGRGDALVMPSDSTPVAESSTSGKGSKSKTSASATTSASGKGKGSKGR